MRSRRRIAALALLAATLAFAAGCGGGSSGSATEVRIPLGAGGVGFLPLFVMRDRQLIEKHASAAGLTDLTVRWIDLGGPAVMNDALLSGSVDLIAAGPPAFITLWDRTRGSADVRGVAAMSSLPMYLNTTNPALTSIDDLSETDKIAVTAVKVSIPSIVMQMHAAERYGAAEAFRFDRYTVSMTHPDALIALLSGGNQINAHFTSPPFHQREIRDSRVRTVLDTDEIMGAVVKRDTGLRTSRRISHCFIMDVPDHDQPLVITDAAVNIAPDLKTKVDITQNAIDLVRALGQKDVRVAILSAMESVNPDVPSTLEAAALCKMADRGQITGAQLDGPLALDNAISPEAAAIKKISSPVAGRANVLVVPDLEAGNMLAKQLTFLANAESAGLVLGARVPIVLTSRADSVRSRIASCAAAMLVAHAQRERLRGH